MRVSDEMIGKALQATGGFLSLAAQRIGCSTRTIQRRISASAKLQQTLNELVEKNLDIAESSLMRKIVAGELGAICFFLKCKGKHRGYIERQEVAVSVPLANADNITDAELESIIGEDQRKGGENRTGEAAVQD